MCPVAEELGRTRPLARHIADFLTDLANAGASGHTLRAYRGDLAQFAAHHDAEIEDLDAATVRRRGQRAQPHPVGVSVTAVARAFGGLDRGRGAGRGRLTRCSVVHARRVPCE